MRLTESKLPRITIGYTYYNEPDFLKEQIKNWEQYPKEVEIVLVDDGSLEFPASDYLQNHKINNFRLFRVDEDLGFNSHGCRNLIAKIANAEFILLSDIDIIFSPETICMLKRKKFQSDRVYRFNMYTSWDTHLYDAPGHQNIFLVSKESYWQADGYDESFTGYHHGDRPFLEKLSTVTKTGIFKDITYRCVRNKRDTVVVPGLEKPVYDDEKMILYLVEKEKTYAELEGTIKTKINFSYTQLL